MLNLLIGALVWQLVTLIVYIATKESEEMALYCGAGLPYFMLAGFMALLRKIVKVWRYRNVRSILTDGETWYCCKVKDVERLRDEHDLSFPEWTDEMREQYPVELWDKYFRKELCLIRTGNLRYAPKKIWQNLKKIS